ncbi:MAG: hypothetical protein K0R78_2519 [Pelosinus sp.]|nr:hypothetical protein [Pelosinus sp.]
MIIKLPLLGYERLKTKTLRTIKTHRHTEHKRVIISSSCNYLTFMFYPFIKTYKFSYYKKMSPSLLIDRSRRHFYLLCLIAYAPFSMPFGFAKIIRPAAVCNTEVTNTPMVSPMCFLPLSTTIIVPSSR